MKIIFEGEYYWYSTPGENIIHRRKIVLNKKRELVTIDESIISNIHR